MPTAASVQGLGTTFAFQASGSSSVVYAGILSMTPPPITIGSRETTNLGSSWGEMLPTGLPKGGEMSLTVLLTFAAYGALFSYVTASANGTAVITYFNGDTETFQCHITGWERGEITPESSIEATIKLQVHSQLQWS